MPVYVRHARFERTVYWLSLETNPVGQPRMGATIKGTCVRFDKDDPCQLGVPFAELDVLSRPSHSTIAVDEGREVLRSDGDTWSFDVAVPATLPKPAVAKEIIIEAKVVPRMVRFLLLDGHLRHPRNDASQSSQDPQALAGSPPAVSGPSRPQRPTSDWPRISKPAAGAGTRASETCARSRSTAAPGPKTINDHDTALDGARRFAVDYLDGRLDLGLAIPSWLRSTEAKARFKVYQSFFAGCALYEGLASPLRRRAPSRGTHSSPEGQWLNGY